MIRVKRPAAVPAKLSGDGAKENTTNQQAYDTDAQAYIDGRRKMVILGAIYNHPSVKPILKSAQHNKCCYCEKSQSDEPGAVEHFRPKNGYKSTPKEKLHKPGYYWLGYEWTNFYFTCCACNNKKSNYFPLVKEAARAKSHHDSIAREKPRLLEPGGKTNPRKHIIFTNQFVQGTSTLGWETIRICGLDRAGLDEERNKLILLINAQIIIALNKNSSPKEVRNAKSFLRACRKPKAPFSAAAADYLRQFGV